MKEVVVSTSAHTEFVEITDRVQQVIDESGVKEGLCVCFVPHTTAGITINENADPRRGGGHDLRTGESGAVERFAAYRHDEGNRPRM